MGAKVWTLHQPRLESMEITVEPGLLLITSKNCLMRREKFLHQRRLYYANFANPVYKPVSALH